MSWSDVIAVLALIISSLLAIVGVLQNKKQNINNLNAYYFNQIYGEHLIKNIPNARKRISIDYTNKIVGYEEMVTVMKNIQRDSLYYKYSDKEYFEELKEVAQSIEDYVTSNVDREFEGEEQTDFMNKLYKMLEQLYRVINKKYLS